MKQVLVINGHPDKQSFNWALAQAYTDGARKTDSTIWQLNITDLKFNPNLSFGYRQKTELEPDLLDAIDKLQKADHIVWVFPMRWYGYPALMKGFIYRTFLPGITFQPVEGKAFPNKLLQGITYRIIVTADTPRWYDYLFMTSPTIHQLKQRTFQFS